MKKSKRLLLPMLVSAAVAFMVAPARDAKSKKAPFLGRNIAHRGLYSETVPENSLKAFARAVEAGYGIELDVRITKDGHIVVFHDRDLKRMTGICGRVEDNTLRDVRRLHLNNTDERVPLLSQVLRLVDGKVPIILELKRGRGYKRLCAQTLRQIQGYKGVLCIESFDPFIVRWFKKNAPQIFRGQLMAPFRDLKRTTIPVAAFALSHSLTNFLGRPHFIAHGIGNKSLLTRAAEKMGAVRVAWTARKEGCEKDNDVVIFEGYKPKVIFELPQR